jgi:dienelactone hydrolase
VVDHWKRGPRRRHADEAELDELLGQTMRARRDARPAPGAFPLVIYSPSINSDPSENAALFEWLASWGYIVASAPSMGRDEIDVSRDQAGARAQLEDLRFVLATAAAEPFVDAERLAAVGFSWGGMAALLLTLDHAAVQAVVSLDGGHRFPDYEPVAASFPGWSAQRLRAALLEISLADEPRVASLGEAARYADVHLWSQPGLLHRDFSWDLIARYRHATGDADYERVRTIYGEWTQAVKAFLDAQLADQDGRWNRFVASGPRSEGASWSSRTASDPPPTPAQLAAMAEQQGVDAVIELVHRYRAADPDLLPYEEDRMIGFVYTWGPERADELQRLLELNLELYPRSATTHVWLAQVHLARDDRDRALASLEAALALDPEHERARRLLERLQPSDD